MVAMVVKVVNKVTLVLCTCDFVVNTHFACEHDCIIYCVFQPSINLQNKYTLQNLYKISPISSQKL